MKGSILGTAEQPAGLYLRVMGGPSIFVSWRSEVAGELERASAKEQLLQHWLEGYSLPPLDNYTDGHAWLLEAVKDIPDLGDKIKVPASLLLQLHVQNKLFSTRKNRLLCNLFFLCAGLKKPETFWTPLLRILEGHNVPPGDHRGIPIIMAFRAALVENQADARFKSIWRSMLGDPSGLLQGDLRETLEFLRGGPIDGFEGILGLPSQANEALIGWALARMSYFLDSSPFGRKQFQGLLERVESHFSPKPWNWQELAGLCNWKPWAQHMVGDPEVEIVYGKFLEVAVVGRSKIMLPEALLHYASELEPAIRELALDFRNSGLADEHLSAQIEQTVCAALN
jgi:hypothetical protein